MATNQKLWRKPTIVEDYRSYLCWDDNLDEINHD